MNILVLAPMDSEYSYFKESLSIYKCTRNLKHKYDLNLIGVGKASAAANTALCLYNPSLSYRYDLVFLIGFAAASSAYSQGDLVFPSSALYHDVSCPAGICPDLERVYQLVGPDDCTILTGDSFVTKDLSHALQKSYSHKVLFDMEAASVAQIVYETEIPLLVGKFISDIPENDSTNLQSFEEFVSSHTNFRPFIQYVESFV